MRVFCLRMFVDELTDIIKNRSHDAGKIELVGTDLLPLSRNTFTTRPIRFRRSPRPVHRATMRRLQRELVSRARPTRTRRTQLLDHDLPNERGYRCRKHKQPDTLRDHPTS